jgi:hypothetical protein
MELIYFFLVSDPLCLSYTSALHFSNYSFWVRHPVNWDDRHLLAHAMASDFLVAWQCLSKRTIGFSLWIKFHTLIVLKIYNTCPNGMAYWISSLSQVR